MSYGSFKNKKWVMHVCIGVVFFAKLSRDGDLWKWSVVKLKIASVHFTFFLLQFSLSLFSSECLTFETPKETQVFFFWEPKGNTSNKQEGVLRPVLGPVWIQSGLNLLT